MPNREDVQKKLSSNPKRKKKKDTHKPLPQPTLVRRGEKESKSLTGKKCGKEFRTWNGGRYLCFVRGKEQPLERTCLPKESPDSI